MTKAWEREKERMYQHYMAHGMKLSQLRVYMADKHNFHASERAYKQKFKEWKWFKKTPRNSGISLGGGMRAPVEPPLTPRRFKMPHAHTSHHPSRHSTSSTGSSPVETIGHPRHMVAASAFNGLNGNSDQSGFPDSQHSVLGLVNVHPSTQPIRTSENFAISLPPVSQLQLLHVIEGIKESALQAVQLLDTGKFEDTERYLSYALKSLQWYREFR